MDNNLRDNLSNIKSKSKYPYYLYTILVSFIEKKKVKKFPLVAPLKIHQSEHDQAA